MHLETTYCENGYAIEQMTPNAPSDVLAVIFAGESVRLARRLSKQLCANRAARVALVSCPVGGWYQNDAVMQVLADLAETAGTVFAVGSDMGAYGALRFGGMVPVDQVVAMSPVATIDPRVGPMDWRYDEEFDELGACEPIKTFRADQYTIVLDPGSIEKRHLDHLNIPQHKLAVVPMAGTVGIAAQTLRDAGCLEGALAMMATTGVTERLTFSLKLARMQSQTYLRALAERNMLDRPGVALWAAQRLAALSTGKGVIEGLIRKVEDVAPEMVA